MVKGALVSEEAGGRDMATGRGRGCGKPGPSFSLKYEKYAGFEEETRVVVFKEHLLLDVAEAQLLEWGRGEITSPRSLCQRKTR